MSRPTADVVRRALQFCRQGFSQKHNLSPAVASTKLYSVYSQQAPAPRTAFHFRHFSDAQTHSAQEESEKQPSAPKARAFLVDLNLCHSPSDVLDLASSHTEVPTALISSCLTKMWNSLKELKVEQSRMELQLMREHAEWEGFLRRVEGGVTRQSNQDLAYSLHALVKLGVHPRARVVQTGLRAAQERINDFDDRSLAVLSSCLENMGDSANLRALKHAVRLLVEARLPDIENVMHFQTMMRLVGRDAPLGLKHKLEAKALSMSDQFSLPNATHMVPLLAALGFHSRPLLTVCSNKIIENISGMASSSLQNVLVACRELRFRDLQLLNAVSEHGASMVPVWSRKKLILLLHSLDDLTFRPQSLLDSFSELVQSDPGALTLEDLLCVLKICSSLNYDSPSLVSCLSSALEPYLQRMTAVKLLNAVYDLAVMGHFPPAPLHALLQEPTVQRLQNMDSVFLRWRMLKVALCLRLERPELYESLSASSLLPRRPPGPPSPPSSRADFRAALRTLVEQREDWGLTEQPFLEDYHYIDAILTRKPSDGDVEGSSAETSRQSVAVLFVPDSAFCFGTSHPRRGLALKLRHLRILGYLPLLVRNNEMHFLWKEQRVDFLRARIFPED